MRKGKPGKVWSEEQKAKASASHTNVPLSEEHKRAIQISMNRPEVLEKISRNVKKAYQDPEMKQRQYEATMKNLAKSDVRDRIRETMKLHYESEEYVNRHIVAMNRPELKEHLRQQKIGKKLSPEHIAKISEGASDRALKRWESVSPEDRRVHMQKAIKASMSIMSSSLETIVKEVLIAMEVKFEPQYPIGPYFVDFFLEETQTVLEINGCWWHGCLQCYEDDPYMLKRRNKDKKKRPYFEACGYSVVTLWEHDMVGDISIVVQRLMA